MAEIIPPLTEQIAIAKNRFKEEFNEDPNIVVYAPGRVNLIGEHTDYNDGFVMPMALPLVTIIVGRKQDGETTTIITANSDVDKPHKITIDMASKLTPGNPKWANYMKGVLANYLGSKPGAFKAVVFSTVPTGGGLSSSAALEVATYMFLDAITAPNSINLSDKALACQKAEHDFANMPCGIMDQFISAMGKEGNALLIDCRSMSSTLIPLTDSKIVVLITNSNVKHELTGSEYPSRRAQCQQAASLLNKKSLRDATIDDIKKLKALKAEDVVVKRARHAISEIERTVEASKALKTKNFKKFGELMVDSHNSLRDDFEVSCPEIDQLVKLALETKGTIGSRITGGGFGGCTVTLVEDDAVDNVIKHIKQNYKGHPKFFICKPSDGAQIVSK